MVQKDSFDERQILNNLKKALPGIVASMSRSVFGNEMFTVSAEDEIELNPGDFVDWTEKNTIVRTDDPRLPPDPGFQVITGYELLERILSNDMRELLDCNTNVDEFGGDDILGFQ